MNVLYYEIHITIEPLFDEDLEKVKQLAISNNYKVANLLMKKRQEDTPERSMYDTFMTGHKKDKSVAIASCIDIVKKLKDDGVSVYRYKIEDVTIDSRNYDLFGIL